MKNVLCASVSAVALLALPFMAMGQEGVVPDLIAYDAFISACEKGK